MWLWRRRSSISRAQQQQNFNDDLALMLRNENQRLSHDNQQLSQQTRKVSGSYWSTIDDLWEKEETLFKGAYQTALGIRMDSPAHPYKAYLDDPQSNASLAASSVSAAQGSHTGADSPTSVADREKLSGEALRDAEKKSDEHPGILTRGHAQQYLKSLSGKLLDVEKNPSRAHLMPKDQQCFQFWPPLLKLVLGDVGRDLDGEVCRLIARLKLNIVAFPTPHQSIFDVLNKGKVVMLPIGDSLSDVAKWQYREPYDCVIVCDSADTYFAIQVFCTGSEDHVDEAGPGDIRKASNVVGEIMKVCADSLVKNWEGFYEGLSDGGGHKAMLQTMKSKLEGGGKVFIPVDKSGKAYSDSRILKISFGQLYGPGTQGSKYVPDPLLLLIKSCINLSAHFYEDDKCKLMSCCQKPPEFDWGESDSVVTLSDFGIPDPVNVAEINFPAVVSDSDGSENGGDSVSSVSDDGYQDDFDGFSAISDDST